MAEEKSSELQQGGGGKSVASDTEDSPRRDRHMLPVWFFVGVLLFIYGVLILIKGITEWSHPVATAITDDPNFARTLANINPTFWWGILLMILGGIFLLVHRPGKKT